MKTNLKKNEIAQRRILRAIFFRKRYESMNYILVENRTLAVFELYMVEIVKKLFEQIRTEANKNFEKPTTSKTNHCTRWSQKDPFCSNTPNRLQKRGNPAPQSA